MKTSCFHRFVCVMCPIKHFCHMAFQVRLPLQFCSHMALHVQPLDMHAWPHMALQQFVFALAATCSTCNHEYGNHNPSGHQLQWWQSHGCASSSHPRTWWSQVAAFETNIPAIEPDHFWQVGSRKECFFLQPSRFPRFDHQKEHHLD